MNNDKHFEKLLNFEESYRMPQFDDSGVQITDFEKYIILMLKYQNLKGAKIILD
jgi:hypothetical protein